MKKQIFCKYCSRYVVYFGLFFNSPALVITEFGIFFQAQSSQTVFDHVETKVQRDVGVFTWGLQTIGWLGYNSESFTLGHRFWQQNKLIERYFQPVWGWWEPTTIPDGFHVRVSVHQIVRLCPMSIYVFCFTERKLEICGDHKKNGGKASTPFANLEWKIYSPCTSHK